MLTPYRVAILLSVSPGWSSCVPGCVAAVGAGAAGVAEDAGVAAAAACEGWVGGCAEPESIPFEGGRRIGGVRLRGARRAHTLFVLRRGEDGGLARLHGIEGEDAGDGDHVQDEHDDERVRELHVRLGFFEEVFILLDDRRATRAGDAGLELQLRRPLHGRRGFAGWQSDFHWAGCFGFGVCEWNTLRRAHGRRL
jgi:hypothetical protein